MDNHTSTRPGARIQTLELPAAGAGEPGSPELITTTRHREARQRLAAELRSLALDLLGLNATDELPAECAALVRGSIERAVSRIVEPALTTLVHQLHDDLDSLPQGMARRIDETRRRHEAGLMA
jgi:hypothetical protein